MDGRAGFARNNKTTNLKSYKGQEDVDGDARLRLEGTQHIEEEDFDDYVVTFPGKSSDDRIRFVGNWALIHFNSN